jgi:hypothetical protein
MLARRMIARYLLETSRSAFIAYISSMAPWQRAGRPTARRSPDSDTGERADSVRLLCPVVHLLGDSQALPQRLDNLVPPAEPRLRQSEKVELFDGSPWVAEVPPSRATPIVAVDRVVKPVDGEQELAEFGQRLAWRRKYPRRAPGRRAPARTHSRKMLADPPGSSNSSARATLALSNSSASTLRSAEA